MDINLENHLLFFLLSSEVSEPDPSVLDLSPELFDFSVFSEADPESDSDSVPEPLQMSTQILSEI